ncbi:MAG: Integral rane protein [Acidimicrobiales bacterium]|nr:Integral rane protein [Acidimicrobiales bacterium]
MLARIAQFCIRRKRLVLVVAGLAFLVSGAVGGGVANRLSTGGFDDPGAESTKVQGILGDRFGAGTPNILLLVTARRGNVDAPDVAAAGKALATEIGKERSQGLGMTEVISYWDLPKGNPLASTNGKQALVLARYADEDDKLVTFADDLATRYDRHDAASPITVRVGGKGPVFAEVNKTIEKDLLRAELIAGPITLVLLLIIFRGVVAAFVPLAIGALAVVGAFLVLFVVNEFTEVSVFALNLTTAMGLGLAIDYSLFIVSRYREELVQHEPDVALSRTVMTAGRTVLFSALTVAASLSALLVFDIAFLRSFAYAGLAVAALAGVYAVVVLPAILAALGTRIDALPVRRRRPVPEAGSDISGGFWHRMATTVMHRPVRITVAVIAVLLVLGAPTTGMKLGFPDDRVLPAGKEARDVQDVVRRNFSSEEAGAAAIVATDVPGEAARAEDVDAYASRLAKVDGVTRVDAETGIYCGSAGSVGGVACKPGRLVVPASASPSLTTRFSQPNATYLSVVPDLEPLSDAGEQFARDLRAVPSPLGKVQVGGQSAQLVDAKASIFGDAPLALAIIAVITFVLLFAMFGSIVVPIKALVLNLLSLSATFGAMVWIFQEGHGAGLLGFTPTGSLAATVPVLMFCIAFGLSMDYEVFLLSRIKEEHDRGNDNMHSVALGLERTGRIVTAAALLISVVFLSFATSQVSFIKLFGIGLTLAVLLDAFVIRGTLVPAFMRLAGEANWWAPGPLRRLHDRYGISEHVHLDDEPSPAEGADRVGATGAVHPRDRASGDGESVDDGAKVGR